MRIILRHCTLAILFQLAITSSASAVCENYPDINQSGLVNAADYTILRSQLGTSTQPLYGDIDCNGYVTARDYTILRSYLGFTTPKISYAKQTYQSAAGAQMTPISFINNSGINPDGSPVAINGCTLTTSGVVPAGISFNSTSCQLGGALPANNYRSAAFTVTVGNNVGTWQTTLTLAPLHTVQSCIGNFITQTNNLINNLRYYSCLTTAGNQYNQEHIIELQNLITTRTNQANALLPGMNSTQITHGNNQATLLNLVNQNNKRYLSEAERASIQQQIGTVNLATNTSFNQMYNYYNQCTSLSAPVSVNFCNP
jgi:Dockerin type I domain